MLEEEPLLLPVLRELLLLELVLPAPGSALAVYTPLLEVTDTVPSLFFFQVEPSLAL